MIENPKNNLMKTPNKDRTYFTSVEMDIFGYSKQCTLFVNDESKYDRGKNPPICALPSQEMNEGSYKKIAEEVRTKKPYKIAY